MVNRAKFNSYDNCIASFINHPASPTRNKVGLKRAEDREFVQIYTTRTATLEALVRASLHTRQHGVNDGRPSRHSDSSLNTYDLEIRNEDGSLCKSFRHGSLSPWTRVAGLHAQVPTGGYLGILPRDPSKGGGPGPDVVEDDDSSLNDMCVESIRKDGPVSLNTTPVEINGTACFSGKNQENQAIIDIEADTAERRLRHLRHGVNHMA